MALSKRLVGGMEKFKRREVGSVKGGKLDRLKIEWRKDGIETFHWRRKLTEKRILRSEEGLALRQK